MWRGEHVGYVPARHAVWFARHVDGGGFAAAYVVDVEVKGLIWKSACYVDILLVTAMRDAPDGTEAATIADEEAERWLIASEEARKAAAVLARLKPIATECAALLRWIGRESDGPSEAKEALLDECIAGLLASAGATPDAASIAKLKRSASSLKGSERRAMQAIDKIVADRDAILLVSSAVLRTVHIDGRVTPEEDAIVRRFIETARNARK